MSFPSGHSSAAFAGFGFLALYLNAKFKIFSTAKEANATNSADGGHGDPENDTKMRRTRHWKLVLWALPWLIALLIAASKVRDGWHHPVDVIFGAIVGTLFAHMAFRSVFRSVYDSRVNHIPRG
jgi:membrane-associated phospholipid phosphatase